MPGAFGVPDQGVHGMSVPLLRETRMPAVIVEVGPASLVVEQGPALADALAAAPGGLGRLRLGLTGIRRGRDTASGSGEQSAN